MTVDGAGSTVSANIFVVGQANGTGNLTVSDGGFVSGNSLIIGRYGGATGTATVTGAASIIASNSLQGIQLGGESYGFTSSAQGTLNVLDGGTARAGASGNRHIVVGVSHGSTGTLNIGNGGLPGDVLASAVAFGNGTGTVNFNHSDTNYVFSTPIIGTGTVNVVAGTTVFTGPNTYSGPTGLVGGTLRAGADATFSENSVHVLNGGTLDLNGFDQKIGGLQGGSGTVSLGTGMLDVAQSGTSGFAGTITGDGILMKSGTGKLILSGANTHTGGTVVAEGTLQGNTTSLQGFILNNSALVFDQALNGTFGGDIDGSGSLTKTGAGQLILSGDNSYTGGTTVTSGILQGDTTSLQGDIVNNSALVFDQALNGTFSGAISGSGSLTKTGTGVLTLTGTNSYTGGTTITGGKLRGDVLSLQGDILNNGSIVFNQGTDATFGGNITGFGDLVKTGLGELTLTGTNTHMGLNTVAAGTLRGDTTSLQSDIWTLSALVFDQATDSTFSRVIYGSGSMTKTGSGALTLTGANTYTGGTTVEAGSLVQGASGAFASNTGYAINGGTLDLNGYGLTVSSLSGTGGTLDLGNAGITVDQAGDTTFAGDFASSGYVAVNSIVKRGSGKLTLTGTGGVSGDVLVDGGTLEVNGSMAFRGIRYLGYLSSGDGTMVVSGAGAALSHQSDDVVGYNGNGVLSVSNGGQVNAWQTFIGYQNTGRGTMTLDGSGTVYNSAKSVTVGERGLGRLTISGGAVLNGLDPVNYGESEIGNQQSATGHATVTGSGSAWTGNFSIYVGDYGTGTLTVADGGRVETGLLVIARRSLGGTDSVGTLNIGAAAADPAAAPGIVTADVVEFGAGAGTINFNHTGTGHVFDAPIKGIGQINHRAGETVLTANSSNFSGATSLSGGELRINGILGGTLTGGSAATLSGSGRLLGSATIDGTLAAGNSPGTLNIGGNLTLTGSSVSRFEFGAPGVVGGAQNDLVNVGGTLTLGGTLQASVGAAGYYRLFQYGTAPLSGAFANKIVTSSDPGFTLDSFTMLTTVPGRVDLLARGAGQFIQFWDGSDSIGNGVVDGGAGTWSSATNWTGAPGAAAINDRWRGSVGVFAGASGGVVTLISASTFDTLQFATDGYRLTGSALFLKHDGATLNVDGGVTATIRSLLADGGNGYGLVKAGAGTLILEGPHSYTGGTTVAAGTLQGDTTSLQGDIVNNGTLEFEQSTDGSFGGVISGSGSLTKSGAGVLTLTGANSFSGGIMVLDGVLSVDGSIGPVTLNGGRLGGTGTIVGLTVNSGATLAPGNSIGTLNALNTTFASGSTYAVEIDDGGFVAGVNNDQLVDAGTVTINGGTVRVTPVNGTDDGTTYSPGSYTIITAGTGVTVNTPFAVSDSFAYLDFNLTYLANDVRLNSVLTASSTFCVAGMSDNQCAAGDATYSLASGGLFNAVLNLSNTEAPAALDSLSGEVHASARTALLNDSRFAREAAVDRMRASFGGVATDAGGRIGGRGSDGVWGEGFGSWSTWGSDGNAATFNRSIGGFVLGADMLALDNLRFGLLGSYSQTSFGIPARASSGSADSYTLGVYGGGDWGAFSLSGGLATGWHGVDTTRSVAFTGFSDTLSASYRARTLQAWGEASYGIVTGGARFEPFANLSYARLSSDAFTETGGAAALSAPASVVDSTLMTLGLRAQTDVSLGGVDATLRGMLGWQHAFGAQPSAAMSFASGGAGFTVAGAPFDRNSLVFDAGVDLNLSDNATLGIGYGGHIGSRVREHAASLSLNLRF